MLKANNKWLTFVKLISCTAVWGGATHDNACHPWLYTYDFRRPRLLFIRGGYQLLVINHCVARQIKRICDALNTRCTFNKCGH